MRASPSRSGITRDTGKSRCSCVPKRCARRARSRGALHDYQRQELLRTLKARFEKARVVTKVPGHSAAHSGFCEGAHQWYSGILAYLGRREEAIAEIQKAALLDPLSPIINTHVGMRLQEDSRLDDAIRQYQKVLEMDPNFWTALVSLTLAYEDQGRLQEAIGTQQRARLAVGDDPDEVSRETKALRLALRTAGARGYWHTRVQLALARFEPDQPYQAGAVTRFQIASLFARLGDRKSTLSWLTDAYARRDPDLGWLSIAEEFDPLRTDPGFRRLLHLIGLPSG